MENIGSRTKNKDSFPPGAPSPFPLKSTAVFHCSLPPFFGQQVSLELENIRKHARKRDRKIKNNNFPPRFFQGKLLLFYSPFPRRVVGLSMVEMTGENYEIMR